VLLELIEAVVRSGNIPMASDAVARLAETTQAGGGVRAAAGASQELTAQEIRVARMARDDLSNPEIGLARQAGSAGTQQQPD
jgi:hypothetical protein